MWRIVPRWKQPRWKSGKPMVEEKNPILASIAHTQEALIPSGDVLFNFNIMERQIEAVRAQYQFECILKWEKDIHLIDSIYMFAFPVQPYLISPSLDRSYFQQNIKTSQELRMLSSVITARFRFPIVRIVINAICHCHCICLCIC